MRKDHRPYRVKRAWLRFQALYARRFVRPHLDHFGRGCTFMRPWCVEVFGPRISIGDFATIIATSDGRVRLAVWSNLEGQGRIRIGRSALICPGVRIQSAESVSIGDDCMLASRVYITDADWHDVYDRLAMGPTAPVAIGDNVWLGDGAIVRKGVTIGANSIIGAGAVVVRDIPPNTVAAGNPARVVKTLDPDGPFIRRSQWFADSSGFRRDIDAFDRAMLGGNTLGGWLRYMLNPRRGD
jgi:acetyltransferase-like isoleucine patch superfamily enzyme